MKKIILYRISSKGYPKLKIDSISKFDCLNNLINTFTDWKIICVADNCDSEILEKLYKYNFEKFYETKLGNPGSFWRLYEEGLKFSNRDDLVYFVEDDYIHIPNASKAIDEGLELFDYVSLYNHPDKYKLSNVSLNPYTKINRYSENTQVTQSRNFIWRTTNSTTMTFAVKGKTLAEDFDVWKITNQIQKDHDFDNFCILTKQPMILKSRIIKQIPRKLHFFFKQKKYLGVCIPGLAIHLEKAFIKPEDYDRFSIPK